VAAAGPLSGEITALLQGEDQVEVVADGAIPDLAFLEVPREDLAHWRLGDALVAAGAPEVVVVPGSDPRVVHACDRHGIDYLIEPLTRGRLRAALRSVRDRLAGEAPDERRRRLEAFFKELRVARAYPDRLTIRSGGTRSILRVEEIDWIEAAANYLRVHAGAATHLVRGTIDAVEQELDPQRFSRIHRCRIVNLERIKEHRAAPNGRYELILRDGTRLEMSRGRRRKLPVLIGAASIGS
jgi:two-component system LytT family response regulator